MAGCFVAIVLSLIIVIAGGIGILTLPVAQYPEIAPPAVQVAATYTGGSIRRRVAAVILRYQLTELSDHVTIGAI